MVADVSLIVTGIVSCGRCNAYIAFVVVLVVSYESEEIRHEPDDTSPDQAPDDQGLHDTAIPLDEIHLSSSEKEDCNGEEDDEDQEADHAVPDGHDPCTETAMHDEDRYDESDCYGRQEDDHEFPERETIEEFTEVLMLPEVSSEERDQADDDDLLPHPDDLPECPIPSELIRDERLQEELQEETDEEDFGDYGEPFDDSVCVHDETEKRINDETVKRINDKR